MDSKRRNSIAEKEKYSNKSCMGAYWRIEIISLQFLEEIWIDWNMQVSDNFYWAKLIFLFVNTKYIFS